MHAVSLHRRAIHCACYAVVAGVLAFAGPTPVDAQERPMLVEYLPQAPSADTGAGAKISGDARILDEPGVMALRIGRAVPEPVIHARALSIVLPGTGDFLSFDDLVVEDLASGYAVYSRDRQSTTSITLVVMGEDVVGTLHHDGAAYGVRPLGDGLTAVYLYDGAQLRVPPEDVEDFVIPEIEQKAEQKDSALSPRNEPRAAQDPGDEIDVLVVYSPNVARSTVNVDARIALLLLNTHLIYGNSGITPRLRVVHSYETSYVPLGEGSYLDRGQDLRRLQAPGDGYLDEALERRDQYGADVVVLLHREARNFCGGGIAFSLPNAPVNARWATWAFAVAGVGVEVCSELDARTFAHEVGHVQGAYHNPEEYDAPQQPYTYGHGFCNAATRWRTVMAYNTRGRCPGTIPHFSNPDVPYEGTTTGNLELHNVARLINETAFTVANFRQSKEPPAQRSYGLPLFVSASHPTLQGFARVINRSERDGTVKIHAIDDAGQRFGPVTLALAAGETKHFNSEDLRDGAPEKGLRGSIQGGRGNNWHMEFETDLDVEPLAYARPRGEGFLTSTHDVAQGASMRWHVPIFNPGSNTGQQSWLRVVNTSGIDTEVRVEGVDDNGDAGAEVVRFDLPGDAARMFSAQALEQGYSASRSDFEFDGRLGDGTGKWQLVVSAERPVQVMSLLLSATGDLSNLSTVTGGRIVRGIANAYELHAGDGSIHAGGNMKATRQVHDSSRSVGDELKSEGRMRPAAPPDAVEVASRRLRLDLATTPAVLHVELTPAADASERRPVDKSENGPSRIGFHRAVPSAFQGDLSSRIDWVPLDDGSIAGTLLVTSPEASAVRAGVHAELPAGGEIRFFEGRGTPGHAGSRPMNRDYPVITREDFDVDGGRPEFLWSPIVEGHTIGIEIALPSREVLSTFSLRLEQVAHISDSMPALQSSKNLECSNHIDVQCRAGDFPRNKELGVARIVVEKSDGSYECTGTLMDDNVDGTFIAHFMTANHCVSTSAEARTVVAYWFNQRAACGSSDVDSRFVVTTGGADLLATSVDQDSTLLRLNRLPTGHPLYFSGWSADPVSQETDVYGLHYPVDGNDPNGGVMKYSSGVTRGRGDRSICPNSGNAGGCFTLKNALDVDWGEGTTEYGSGGSGLFSDRYLVGVLAGHGEGCEFRTDHYGAFSDFYPRISRWMRPRTRPPPPPASARVLPLVTPASDLRQTFVRIVNRSDRAGTVHIHAIDDGGRSFGPVSFSMDAGQTRHFNSADLETGNPAKGLSAGIGDGEGNWRLALATDLDIEPLAYIRTPDGFLTSIHDVAEQSVRESDRHHVPIFNPGNNAAQQSWLRVSNASGADAEVIIEGLDDRGVPLSSGEVRFTLPAYAARTFSARELEQGYSQSGSDFEFDGSFGNGTGKWQLFVSADRPIRVMSLLFSASNKLTNLSTVTGDDIIWGTAGGDELYGGNRDDMFNPLGNTTAISLGRERGFDTIYGSRGDDTIIYTENDVGGYQQVDYTELSDGGLTVTINGTGNVATVVKGSAGTDTLVDIIGALQKGGFDLVGTQFDDGFDLTIGDGQFISVEGAAGDDEFTFGRRGSASIAVDYFRSPRGIDIDLGARRTHDDGFGDVDTFHGDLPTSVQGSTHSDVIRGSDGDDFFYGREGDDEIDGGGGFDIVSFSYLGRFSPYLDVVDLEVDMDAGRATGLWNGAPFTYTLRSIEGVRGGNGDDVFRGALEVLTSSPGNDRIVYTDGGAYGQLNYHRLPRGVGVTVTLDGGADVATVDKGPAGTDTIENVAALMSWDGGGFGISGSDSDDVFNITMGEEQWMQVRGRAGNDTFNIETDLDAGGLIRMDYRYARNGVDVDLEASTVSNDGHGDVDTVNGDVWQVHGSRFADVIRGSGIDEHFIGGQGNDIIDGRGGFDAVRFDRSCCADIEDLHVLLGAGRATGTWDGELFIYTVSNIEEVRGSDEDDIIEGNANDNNLRGRGGRDKIGGGAGNDELRGEDGDDDLSGGTGDDNLRGDDGNDVLRGDAGDDQLRGGGGSDEFVFEPGHGQDNIRDFADGVDRIVLKGFGISKADVLSNAGPWSDDVGVWIDLTDYGGGGIDLAGFEFDNLDESDFRIE